MRFGMMAAVGMLAATAGMAHGELENGKPWSVPNYSLLRTVGVCEPMANLPDDPYFGRARLAIAAVAANYLFDYEKLDFDERNARVTLLQAPAHGEMTEIAKGAASYKPDRNFHGQDKIVALVELGGYQVKVVYFIKVQPEGTGGIATDDEEMIKQFCGPKGRTWEISSSFTTPNFDNAALQVDKRGR